MKGKSLIIYSMLIPPVMALIFSTMSSNYGKTIGYFASYGIYLTISLIGCIIFSPKDKKLDVVKDEDNIKYYLLAFIPVVVPFFVTFMPTIKNFSINLFVITFINALLNGIIEESFWRNTYNKVFQNNVLYAYIVPTIIFSIWHFALLCAKGVSYNGGASALVGGAAVMGFIWGSVVYKTKNIKVTIVAHVLVNFFAFSQLIYENWYV